MSKPRQRETNFVAGLDLQLPPNSRARPVDERPEKIPAADREMVLRGLEQVHNNEIASEEEVQALLARYRF